MNATTAADKGFNSTTVQLIQRCAIKDDEDLDAFQFHNGTINTVRKGKTGWSEQVSIPQRYN